MSRLNQFGVLVADPFATTFLTAAACFMVSRDLVSAGCRADSECFCAANEAVVRCSAKAALDAETDAELTTEAAEAAAKVKSLVAEMVAAVLAWSTPGVLPLLP